MSNSYYHNGVLKHAGHAQQITDHLMASYPRWVSTSELTDITQSMNTQARIHQVRAVYGDSQLKCQHRLMEAYYRLCPTSVKKGFNKDRKRMMVPCLGLNDADKDLIRDFAKLIMDCREQGFNKDEMLMVLDGARLAVQQVVDLNAVPDDGADWFATLTPELEQC